MASSSNSETTPLAGELQMSGPSMDPYVPLLYTGSINVSDGGSGLNAGLETEEYV